MYIMSDISLLLRLVALALLSCMHRKAMESMTDSYAESIPLTANFVRRQHVTGTPWLLKGTMFFN